MIAMKRGWMLVSVLLALLSGCAECAAAQTPLAVTTVQDTVYTASGATASGTVLVSWSGFTTASGAVVPAGTTSATIGTSGLLSIALAPNAGATPMGSYYTATFHLSDGSTSREYWVIPVTVAGAAPVKLAAIQNQVLPTSVAMQTVSKSYVDTAIATAVKQNASAVAITGGTAILSSLTVPVAMGTSAGWSVAAVAGQTSSVACDTGDGYVCTSRSGALLLVTASTFTGSGGAAVMTLGATKPAGAWVCNYQTLYSGVAYQAQTGSASVSTINLTGSASSTSLIFYQCN